MGSLSRQKGIATEREIVKLHRAIGVAAERVPLSGGTNYQGNSEDVDIHLPYLAGPLCCQVKRLNGHRGTKGIVDALGDADALFVRFDAEPGQQVRPPLVVLPWATWEMLLLARK